MAKKSTRAVAIAKEDEWRVESDLNTLMEAEKIKADPKRFAKCQVMAKERMMAVAKVAADTDND